MGAISKADAPIVFMGAMITKLVLAESGYTALERNTKDIDANWIGAPPSMSKLTEVINMSLRDADMRDKYFAEVFREYTPETSAGIYIVNTKTGIKEIKADININPVHGSRIYYYGDLSIKGVLPNKILADKISVLSGSKLFRRAKDAVDVYALSHCVKIRVSEIYDVCAASGNEIQSFDAFYTRQSDLEHAYNKLSGIEGKPDFAAVYSHLEKFIAPFAQKNAPDKEWSITTLAWGDIERGLLNLKSC